jgi:lia operon protein LiaG
MLHDSKANKIFLIIIVALLGIGFASKPVAKKMKGEQMQTLDIAEGADLDVLGYSDSITVIVDPAAEQMTVSYKGTNTLETGGTKNHRTIRVSHEAKRFFNFSLSGGMVMVTLPSRSLGEVTIKSESGSIDVMHAIDAQAVTVQSISGSVDVGEVRADDISISSTSGRVQVSQAVADTKIAVASVSGSVDVLHADAPEVIIKSVSGSVDAKASMKKGNLKVSSTSGSLNVELEQPNPSYRLEAHSTSGTINGPNMSADHSASTTQGNGDVSVNLSTVSGSINFTTSN